jgi:hypothetical protein
MYFKCKAYPGTIGRWLYVDRSSVFVLSCLVFSRKAIWIYICREFNPNLIWSSKTARYRFYLLLLICILSVHTANECSLKSAKKITWPFYLVACYFSVYTSIYLCCSFWYRFESSLLIKGSLVCFTLEIHVYNLSISFRNWTKIYNEEGGYQSSGTVPNWRTQGHDRQEKLIVVM